MSEQMQPRYEPQGVEERWQEAWEAEGHYNADPDPSRESFAIAHPPPNVTGDLHLGHALQLSLADTIVRTRRMQGYNVLFQPGYDHAGISTQNAVEKTSRRGEDAQDLGREAFEARVWEWLHEYGGKIMMQFRRIGASLDTAASASRWTGLRASGDALLRPPVEQGLDLPRQPNVNWCPFHLTSPRISRWHTST
jgi:valyl-tRNA synthetase